MSRSSKPPTSRPAPRSASRRKRERRREAARAQTQPRGRRRLWIWNGVGAAVIVVAALVVVLLLKGGSSPAASSTSPAPSATPSIPQLAGLTTAASGATVDGIQCQTMEQLAYHIHAHLAVYVNGSRREIPEGVGITKMQTIATGAGPYALTTSGCYYWLHTHTNDGIIHIESPSQQTYTLGQFFDIWGQPLSAGQVGPAKGTLTVYVNGQLYTGDVRAITLTVHELIQLDVGTAVTPQPFTFPPQT